jgi:hypothetical protein
MTTTIKVSTETRDRLKAQAAAEGISLGEHLARLADLADRRDRLERLRVAVAGMTADQWESYAAESDAWQSADLTTARPR